LKTDTFEPSPKSALGTVDRMIVFKYLQVGRLHKQQVVAPDDPHQCCTPAIRLWNSHPQFRLHSGEAFLGVGRHPSDCKRVVLYESSPDHLHFAVSGRVGQAANQLKSLTSFGLQ
jgi:hypothetical protein